MNSLKHIRDQLVAAWNRANKGTRAIYAAVSAASILLIIGVGIWSSRPQFVPLATGLSPTQAAQIVDLLDDERITNKMNFSGSTVLVSKKDFGRARLAIKDITGIASPPVDEEPSFPGFGSDPDRSKKRLEQKIAQTLMQMKAIKYASVTLALPEETPFVRERKSPTAAVVLELHPNYQISTQRIGASVASTVTNSVLGLTPDNVTVFDTNGVRLFSGSEGGGGMFEQLELQRRIEADITAKAHRMLAEVLGEGAAVVRVAAEINRKETFRRQESYDQDLGGKTKEWTRSEKNSGSGRAAEGVPGTSSNLRNELGNHRSQGSSQQIEEFESELLPGKKEETEKERPGGVKRLTVAATVDLSRVKDNAGQTYTQENLEALVKQAVGFNESRGDEITLLIGKIVGITPLVDDLDSGIPWWQKYERLLRSLSLGLAALVAFVIGMLIIRRLRPISVGAAEGDSERRHSDMFNELTSRVRDNPDAVSRILAAWLNDPGKGVEDSASETNNATSIPLRRRAA